ncbi:hypothetical protein QBC33DRAFT_544318 [Phialemonium atrogriseum]|uniref:Secreted protein n=1 Tax=Phialemonium atrogriseum TaxID=1093897 RepID=A0AAJ0BW94_9PEZI|nr:uncharacterized protein QBC33DRAFT_544318 [Phialemonium atrogriseum]KAK1765445.1 hypothetical protein QBC33DRAFT_544318 [Phialemonium atrogriseum]
MQWLLICGSLVRILHLQPHLSRLRTMVSACLHPIDSHIIPLTGIHQSIRCVGLAHADLVPMPSLPPRNRHVRGGGAPIPDCQ